MASCEKKYTILLLSAPIGSGHKPGRSGSGTVFCTGRQCAGSARKYF